MTSNAAGGSSAPRRPRYARASTSSVTQMLTDSCSSLLNRLTRRGPSEKSERLLDHCLTSARTRYNDNKPYGNGKDRAGVLVAARRYEANQRLSPYSPFASGSHHREDRQPLVSYGAPAKSRIEITPVRSFVGAKNRLDDAFPRLTTFAGGISSSSSSDKIASPILSTRRYPLRDINNKNKHDVLVDSTAMGSTRSRLEDKYSSVLDRIALRKKERQKREQEERDKTLEAEPSMPLSIVRSFTTAMFGEKSYTNAGIPREKTRDKTPYRSGTEKRHTSRNKSRENKSKHKHLDIKKDELDVCMDYQPNVYGKDRNSVYRRHRRRSLRVGKSETNERKLTALSICPDDGCNPGPGLRDLVSPLYASMGTGTPPRTRAESPVTPKAAAHRRFFADDDDETTPTGDPALSERETRRKEIQSLIMKYAALDEVYGRSTEIKPLLNGDLKTTTTFKIAPHLKAEHLDRTGAIKKHLRHGGKRANTPPVRYDKHTAAARMSSVCVPSTNRCFSLT